MAEYLNIQRTARRLGVSASTVRRWTATGLLPCERTPGGHRRISTADIDELARSLGGGQLAARRARERELETVLEVSAALTSQLDLTALLVEIAGAMTRLAGCDYCAVSEYDERTRRVRTLAEYDATGRRVLEAMDYRISKFPLTRRVLEEQVEAVVNVDDRWADAAEVAELRRGGDQSILILPLVYSGRSVGLIELTDAARTRSFDRRELRVFRAVAGQAAVALHNARTVEELARSADGAGALRQTLDRLTRGVPEMAASGSRRELLQSVAVHVCDALGALSCVVAFGDLSAGVSRRPRAGRRAGEPGSADGVATPGTVGGWGSPSVLVRTSGGGGEAPQPAGHEGGPITATLAGPAQAGQAELLDLVATAAAVAVRRLPPS